MGNKKRDPGKFSFQPFEDLKKIVDLKGIKLEPRQVPLKKEEVAEEEVREEDDDRVFVEAMREVREIKEFRRLPARRPDFSPTGRKCSTDREALDALREILSGRRPMHLPDTPEYVEWVNRDYRDDIIRKLHEGKFSIQDSLDLHGLNLPDAEAEVASFLKDSMRMRLRCVKIIHGRGLRSPAGPVLKNAVMKMLSGRFRKKVIAFVSARQCDGGLGALYVLLR
ncbi:MAG: Smr/MutS family protein [Candidatus Sulfobium sp.]|jgi:DNA-nicking Smr family endonuclease